MFFLQGIDLVLGSYNGLKRTIIKVVFGGFCETALTIWEGERLVSFKEAVVLCENVVVSSDSEIFRRNLRQHVEILVKYIDWPKHSKVEFIKARSNSYSNLFCTGHIL